MKTLITQLLIASLVWAPLQATARDGNSTDSQEPPQSIVHGEPYLDNCRDILNLAPDNYEEALVSSAQTESQILQLLYDGGVLFSPPFFKAFFSALDSQVDVRTTVGRTFANEKQKRRRYRAVANAIAKISRWPQRKLNQFIWQMFDIEKAMAAEPTNAGAAVTEVRYRQVSSLVDALSKSANRLLIEKALRHVISQMLMQTAASILMDLPGLPVSTKRWRDQLTLSALLTIPTAFLGMLVAPPGASEHLQNVAGTWTLITMGVVAVGPGLAVEANRLRKNLLNRRFQAKLDAIRKNQSVYVFAVASGEERVEFANLISEYLELEGDLPAPYHNTTISISYACKTETCSLNPIQLAYLGAVDLLELESLFRTLRESIGSRVGAVNDIRDAATAVAQDPENYNKQMSLRSAIEKFSSGTGQLNKAELLLLDRLSKKIEHLKADFAVLQEKPYVENRTTPESQARGLLLMNRINTDLRKLDNLQLNVDRFKTSIEISDNSVSISREWLQTLPRHSTGWGEAAEHILQQLNQAGKRP